MREVYPKFSAILVIAIIVFLSYLVVKPFLISIITTAIIAYIFYPINKFLLLKINRKNLIAFFMCILVFLILVLPFLFIISSLIHEIPGVYSWISSTIQSSKVWKDFIYERLLEDFQVNLDLTRVIADIFNSILNYAKSIITTMPTRILNISISAFFLFFFFRDGEDILKKIVDYLPFRKTDITIIFRELKQMTDAVVYGQVITAVIQAILATLGYTILGVKAPLFWGIMTFLLSLIPMIGPSLIYLPLSISIIITSIGTSDTFGIVRGAILLGYGWGIISTVDNIIKPLVISDRVSMHPGIVLVGVLGGLATFGVFGIILGPMVLILLKTIIDLYKMKDEVVSKVEHKKRTS